MAPIGTIGEFDGSLESLDTYLERVEEYFAANIIGIPTADTDAAKKIADRQKTASLNSLMGRKSYAILKDLCKPDKPNTKTFEEITKLLKTHFQPDYVEIAEAVKFHRAVQKEGETVAA